MYIKRELILNDLGIPMNKDVREYYDHIVELLGDYEIENTRGNSIYDLKLFLGGKKIAVYDEKYNTIFLSEEIWYSFKRPFNLNMTNASKILTPILDHILSIKVTRTNFFT